VLRPLYVESTNPLRRVEQTEKVVLESRAVQPSHRTSLSRGVEHRLVPSSVSLERDPLKGNARL
jgi:hypothetical protein